MMWQPFDRVTGIYQRWAQLHHKRLVVRCFRLFGLRRWSILIVRVEP